MASRLPGEEPAAGAERSWSSPIRSEAGSLLEQVAVAVFGLDEDDRVCSWGPGARELFGHPARDVLGRPSTVLFPTPDPGAPDPGALLAERARTLGYWRVRMPALHRDGTVFDCGFRGFPVTGTGGSDVMVLASNGVDLDRVKTNLSFLDSLFESCPIGLAMLDEELRYVHLNQALADMDGVPLAEHFGRRVDEVTPVHDRGAYLRMLRRVAAGGPPVVGALVAVRTAGDVEQVRSVSFFPLSGAGDSRRGCGGVLLDVTDRERAIVEAAAARRRLELLDRASARIGTTLDVRVTAGELVGAVVPEFCDGSVVELVQWADEAVPFDPARPLVTRRIAAHTVLPPPAPEMLAELDTVTYPPASAIHDMLRTGRPIAVQVDADFAARTVVHKERAGRLLHSGLASLVIAPLVARGTVQGITMFGRGTARPAFTEADLQLAGELASRAALSLDNALLYSRVQDIALTLQRALLPSAPATSPYVDVAHRYLPGGRVTEVGGDWYDVLSLAGGRIALVVGDVMGHGVPAAAAMGRLHTTAKAVARYTERPEEVLAELDVCAREAGIELATCLYLVYDPDTGRARIGNAGHPPPLARHPDGSVRPLGDVLGVPLGVGGVPFRSTGVELPEGSVLALYTDGLVEARGRDLDVGLAGLHRALSEEAGSARAGSAEGLEAAADRILARLLPEAPTDDTVLMLARVHRTGRAGGGAARG
ncbi:SpoIIE family protein phosphatase [Streptomyces sp. NRRL S-87]|uniref:SpoIIE family protein phosphatase n=1 Tax=Streptomyces sp. NRRL S-87 TaxID=1463920 RepID=UPI0004C14A87|nr:SpoIIE family protein phosphatase [Streptomyces sp. NRRL S-87]